jgi:uncharacterized membrane protein
VTYDPLPDPALDDWASDDAHGAAEPPTPSVAAVAGHPLHPMVVPLPIGALSLTLASDLAYAATRDRFFARASQALLAAGIGTGLVAGSLGFTDFAGRERIRRHGTAWIHGVGNAAALGLSVLSLSMRRGRRDAVLPAGLLLSLATGSILLVTGWLGGELSYRHRIGVTRQ